MQRLQSQCYWQGHSLPMLQRLLERLLCREAEGQGRCMLRSLQHSTVPCNEMGEGKGKGDAILVCMVMGPVTFAWRRARATACCAASIAAKSYACSATKGSKTLEKRFNMQPCQPPPVACAPRKGRARAWACCPDTIYNNYYYIVELNITLKL